MYRWFEWFKILNIEIRLLYNVRVQCSCSSQTLPRLIFHQLTSAHLYNIHVKLLHSIIGIVCEWSFDAVECSLDIQFRTNSWKWLEPYAKRQQLALSLKGLFRSMLPLCLSHCIQIYWANAGSINATYQSPTSIRICRSINERTQTTRI